MGAFLSGLASKVGSHYKKKVQKKYGTGGGSKPSSGGFTDNAGMSDTIGSFKRGGLVKKTGLAKVHKGERVLTKRQQKRGSSKY
jgi:hypothetical protein